ncbi:multidrug transporter, partial [Klebsiella pneumoniae]|nr:multidrug transporter [Klebsiella pneumoniae]
TAAQLSLVSEVATAYFTLRTDQALLELARDTAEAQRRSHELTQLLAEVGEAGELDVRRTEIALRSAEADQAVYERQAAQDLN